MGYSNGPAAADLADSLIESDASEIWPEDVRNYSFYQLVELLNRITGHDPESADWEQYSNLLFSADPSLSFAASDVTKLETIDDRFLRLQTSFFGLSGAQSPLPSFLLEQMIQEDEQGLRKLFMDFFNHRLISLVYRVWRKYRYYLRFREDASDQYSSQLFALVGLADDRLRGDTPINWCKMLAYSGMLAGRSRSPQVVSGIIAHCFDLDSVSIRQWELRHVIIPETQKMQLGTLNTSLGQDCVIGVQMEDRMGKFVICIHDLTLARFNDFLPSGKDHEAITKLVTFILREQMAFDLELGLRVDETPALRLGERNSACLGWTSFTGEATRPRRVLIQIRQ